MELEGNPAIRYVFANSRMNPELGPFYKVQINTRTRRGLEAANIWNLAELETEYKRLGRNGFRRFSQIGHKGIDEIEAILANPSAFCSECILPLKSENINVNPTETIYQKHLSQLTRSALAHLNIKNLAELKLEYQSRGRNGLLSLPGIGKAAMIEIESALQPASLACEEPLTRPSPMDEIILFEESNG